MHTIQNEFLQISVKQKGAELCSIKSVKSKKEFMWEADPEIWGSSSPVLFPIVGGLKDNTYIFQEKRYTLPRHGFIRNNSAVELTESTPDSLTFALKYNQETWKAYPFKFEFSIKYTLIENKIMIDHSISNVGSDLMLFSLGAHPAFKCPINPGETYENYYLEFEKTEHAFTWLLDNQGQVTKNTKPILINSNILSLNRNLFDQDALIFKNLNSSKVSLKSNTSNQVITLNYLGFPYLGIWAKPQANFVCIEPWLGIADSSDTNQNFETKEAILKLAAGQHFDAVYSIEIKE